MKSKAQIKKAAGRLFAAAAALLLILSAAGSVYIGGMKRAAEKFCASLASGSDSDLAKASSEELSAVLSAKAARGYFSSLPEFAELEEGDIIGSRTTVRSAAANGTIDSWVCSADVDYFSDGMSVSYKQVEISLCFSGGKWRVVSTDLPVTEGITAK